MLGYYAVTRTTMEIDAYYHYSVAHKKAMGRCRMARKKSHFIEEQLELVDGLI